MVGLGFFQPGKGFFRAVNRSGCQIPSSGGEGECKCAAAGPRGSYAGLPCAHLRTRGALHRPARRKESRLKVTAHEARLVSSHPRTSEAALPRAAPS